MLDTLLITIRKAFLASIVILSYQSSFYNFQDRYSMKKKQLLQCKVLFENKYDRIWRENKTFSFDNICLLKNFEGENLMDKRK